MIPIKFLSPIDIDDYVMEQTHHLVRWEVTNLLWDILNEQLERLRGELTKHRQPRAMK